MIDKLLAAALVGILAGAIAWHGLGPWPGLAIGYLIAMLVMLAPTYPDQPRPRRCPDWCDEPGLHRHVTR